MRVPAVLQGGGGTLRESVCAPIHSVSTSFPIWITHLLGFLLVRTAIKYIVVMFLLFFGSLHSIRVDKLFNL